MKTIAIVILAIVVCTTSAWQEASGTPWEVRIVTDDGRTLPTYPVKMRHGAQAKPRRLRGTTTASR